MRGIRQSVLLLCLGSLGIQTLDIAARGADEVAAQAPPGYSSPQEAFEARRKALAKRNWRTCFASSTPAAQALEVENLVGSWILIEGGLVAGPFVKLEDAERRAGEAKFRTTMKKHGLQLPIIYFDEEKLIKTMTSRVINRAGFYEEVSEILRSRGQEDPGLIYDFGDLQGIAVSGDSARGWIVWNCSHVYEDGVKKVTKSVRLLRKFRRLDGRWFNDNQTWDYTHFDPEEVQR